MNSFDAKQSKWVPTLRLEDWMGKMKAVFQFLLMYYFQMQSQRLVQVNTKCIKYAHIKI